MKQGDYVLLKRQGQKWKAIKIEKMTHDQVTVEHLSQEANYKKILSIFSTKVFLQATLVRTFEDKKVSLWRLEL